VLFELKERRQASETKQRLKPFAHFFEMKVDMVIGQPEAEQRGIPERRASRTAGG
jgi:hypothetical protein